LVLAGRWWKKSSNQIHDNIRTKHIVPKLTRRVFIVFVLKQEQAVRRGGTGSSKGRNWQFLGLDQAAAV
jgi:hypothetical protein